MRIRTLDFEGVALNDVIPDDIHPAIGADGVLRMVDDAPVFPLRGVMIRDADGQVLQTSTVRVRATPTTLIPALTALRCVNCVVTPWVRDGRIALSVLADHVEPMTSAAYMETDDE